MLTQSFIGSMAEGGGICVLWTQFIKVGHHAPGCNTNGILPLNVDPSGGITSSCVCNVVSRETEGRA